MLYPQTNDARMVFSLDGVWNFRTVGETDYPSEWTTEALPEPIPMAVPGSYNDQNDMTDLYDVYGWVVYQRTFSLPERVIDGQRVVLRFDAATHAADVYLNGEKLGSHKGGFLPFEFDVTDNIKPGDNLLAVAIDNRINQSTLPIGNEGNVAFFGSDNAGIPSVEAGKRWAKPQNRPNFDFFNFAGLNRHVELYTTPRTYIADVAVTTKSITEGLNEGETGPAVIGYMVTLGGESTDERGDRVTVTIQDENGDTVATATGTRGEITLPAAHLWNPGAAYLYTAHVALAGPAEAKAESDEYDQTFGVRTVEVKDRKFLINGRPFYFKGFGKHEDSYFHGRGTDQLLNVKDVSLIHWLNANSFRTSHYPYAENMYDLCDREGIVIIDETPAVGMSWPQYTNKPLFEHHQQVIRDMIARDKNHPSVVMWSLANEPWYDQGGEKSENALKYFTPLYELAHEEDPQNRPVTIVCCQNDYTKDLVTRTMDVVCLNRYYGWYNLSGDLDAACYALNYELDWWEKIGKPVMFTEYGADTMEGVHGTHGKMWSEEYQRDYFARIDAEIDKRPWFIGEQLWNFADFVTIQGTMRVEGNRKGILTRDRQPKMAAHFLRGRWAAIPDFGYKG
ncbi:beta-glucuronidase [Bifidobacterium callimiconis]|uniref:Beta-glucuronidase n=1 Tax=Bifidobacterium callimiconis TaxID=2306973 RepID=A0A430FI37_9BIFI|nr:beta-glucuronidase [Bifidobacterium callimiconis]MBT1176370.1 beta-glucuronidase [Bifidobacterium callimiconis]RSX52506.1 beta-galactosidase [Bifidobacterium callimiconis]